MNPKILFTDLDGTLLNDEKEITPGNREAINTALEQGHYIVISTGRPLVGALIQAKRLDLLREGCYAITYNGAQIYDLYHQKTLFGKPLPMSVVEPLFQAAGEMGLHIQTYSSSHILSLTHNKHLEYYAKLNLLPYKIVDNITAALEEPPYKIITINYDNMQPLVDFQNQVLPAYDGILNSFFSSEALLEMVPAGISKGFAVQWMCDYLNIPIENSVAAGDAQNDVPMLEAAHVGAVMCNAFPGIAEHGNYITQADNNHDGVAEIIRKFIL